LSDVAIIDENNIWAVGAVYLYDSLGNIDQNVYNAIHWDGNNWTVKRISTLNRGQYDATVLNAIVAFSAKDIWVSDGAPIHGDGTNWTLYHLWDMGVLGPNDGSSMCIWGHHPVIYTLRVISVQWFIIMESVGKSYQVGQIQESWVFMALMMI
jgi:hypothetical protein